MDAILALAQTPGGQLFLELASIALCFWLVSEIKSVRKENKETSGRLGDHEVQCATRWGQVKTKLGITD